MRSRRSMIRSPTRMPQDKELDVSFKATPGGVYQLGAIHFEGMKRLDEAFLQKRVKLHAGDQYSPSRIERARTDLLALGTFAGISVRLPKEADVQGGSPAGDFRGAGAQAPRDQRDRGVFERSGRQRRVHLD